MSMNTRSRTLRVLLHVTDFVFLRVCVPAFPPQYLSFLPETVKSDSGSNSGSGSISGGEKAYTWAVDQVSRWAT